VSSLQESIQAIQEEIQKEESRIENSKKCFNAAVAEVEKTLAFIIDNVNNA
jgi:predicted  nucleic acid-binding Zn-ribbon protein